jgi:type I restriction enzyme S subunit
MSKLDYLIQERCPNGVPTHPIGELFEYQQPTKNLVSSTDYVQSGTPVLTAGQTFILGYTKEKDGIYKASSNEPVIIFDDFTTAFKWVDFDFKAKSSAMKMIRAKSKSQIELRYLFHWMGDHNFRPGEHSRHWISVYSQIQIPWPPLDVQKEIVSILDNFTQLEAELEAELEARRTQYEATRDRLLDFSADLVSHPLRKMIMELGSAGVEYKTLGELLGTIPRGKRLTKSELPEGGLIPVFHGGLEPIGFTDQANTAAMTVMVINVGASAGTVGWSEKPFWCSDGCYAMPHSDLILPKYLYYCALSNQGLLVERVRKAGIPTLAADSVLALEIPVPPLKIQEEIVSILDKLDALCNDIAIGLPAEIAVRRKQYEYYRNKLLTFKELDAA